MLRRAALVIVLLALAGCAGLGGERVLHVPHADLQALLDKRFPVRQRMLDLFELQLSNPRLQLRPEMNRLGTEIDVRGIASARTFDAVLALTYALRYEPGDATVRLAQPRIERLEGADGTRLPAQARPLVQALGEAALDGLVLYRLSPERSRALRASGYRPSALKVTADGIDISFEAANDAAPPAQ
jgi:hypothetical protein